MFSNEEDAEVDVARARLSRLLKKQQPFEDYFGRLAVDARPCGMPHSDLCFVLSCFPIGGIA